MFGWFKRGVLRFYLIIDLREAEGYFWQAPTRYADAHYGEKEARQCQEALRSTSLLSCRCQCLWEHPLGEVQLAVSLSRSMVGVLPDDDDLDAPEGSKIGPRINVLSCGVTALLRRPDANQSEE